MVALPTVMQVVKLRLTYGGNMPGASRDNVNWRLARQMSPTMETEPDRRSHDTLAPSAWHVFIP